MVLYFDMGGGYFNTHALLCKIDADYCKHVILTAIRHLPIIREATFASLRIYKQVRFVHNWL